MERAGERFVKAERIAPMQIFRPPLGGERGGDYVNSALLSHGLSRPAFASSDGIGHASNSQPATVSGKARRFDRRGPVLSSPSSTSIGPPPPCLYHR